MSKTNNQWLLVLGFLSVACNRGPDSRVVITPDGYTGCAISCRHAIDCMEEAGRRCPGGYLILDNKSETESHAAFSASQSFASGWASVEETGTVLIQCRRAVK